MAAGVCKLTTEYGPFVRSHIIPRALTPRPPGGLPFAQIGQGQRPVKRLDSWYDDQLVTRAGEDILTDHDTFGIAELRRLKLVWHSWGPMQELTVDRFTELNQTHGVRTLEFSDPSRMRKFFLSLLWRAAASKRPEFAEIVLRASDFRRLTAAVKGPQPVRQDLFPVTLTQLSSIGPMHNHGPLSMVKRLIPVKGVTARELKTFRFFFDGLIAHFHVHNDAKTIDGLLPMLVGEMRTTVTTIKYNASWQNENVLQILEASERTFPGERARIERRKRLA